jgi:glucokinase
MTLRGGIDVGGTKIQAVVVDEADAVLGSARCATPGAGGPPAVVAAIVEVLGQAARAAGVAPAELVAVGVGSPGAVDAVNGTVARAGNLPDWSASYPLGSVLGELLGMRVGLGNDVGVATEAEFALGAGRPYRSLLGVFWGTGVGGGLILDGRAWHGRGGAGEIGHTVIQRGGARCPCGRSGCLEAYAGRGAMEARARTLEAEGHHTELFDLMRKRGRTRLTSGVWARALRHSDELATKIVDEAVAALGAGIASAVNLLDVEAVVIGGGLGDRLGAPYVERIVAAMGPHLFADDRPPAVMPSALGDLGGAHGAARLVSAPA